MTPKNHPRKGPPGAKAPTDLSKAELPNGSGNPDLSALAELVRYQDPETGNTWCGFGRPPNWIRGKDRARFRIA
ncbi:H-NS family nucleoid-associated regulatory protein [Achromobacter sp. UMC46]|uniref:H-NS family nucleoid-associated regulatory protein n=1 Tax=Achromobacter sp. UMC46 TaxID=1862319 RepID=UPI0016000B8A|nr:H-NS family nucleoid-associated regulatory protein [Achromobacter sp. UMC46]